MYFWRGESIAFVLFLVAANKSQRYERKRQQVTVAYHRLQFWNTVWPFDCFRRWCNFPSGCNEPDSRAIRIGWDAGQHSTHAQSNTSGWIICCAISYHCPFRMLIACSEDGCHEVSNLHPIGMPQATNWQSCSILLAFNSCSAFSCKLTVLLSPCLSLWTPKLVARSSSSLCWISTQTLCFV